MKKIYINGKFITLEENEKNKIEAILIEDKIIRKVGTKEEILKYQDKETKIIDLKGKTMMPSFIDAHILLGRYSYKKLWNGKSKKYQPCKKHFKTKYIIYISPRCTGNKARYV